MKRSKKITLLSIIFILISTIKIYASEINEITMNTTDTSVIAGEEIIITISAKCTSGIEGLDSTLKYDETKLKLINEEQFTTTDFVSMSGRDEATNEFKLSVLYSGTGNAPENTELAKLKFKVIDEVKAGEALDVQLLEIEIGDSNDVWTKIGDKKVTLTIENKEVTEEDKTNENVNKPDNEKEEKDETVSNNIFNKAGLIPYTLITIASIIVLAVFLYMKSRKYEQIK